MLKRLLLIVLILAGAVAVAYIHFLGSPGGTKDERVFVVSQDGFADTVTELRKQGFVKNEPAFRFLMGLAAPLQKIEPGGYRLTQQMDAWSVIKKVTGRRDLMWITITACQRKEQIGEKLAAKLEWPEAKLAEWNKLYSQEKREYFEGVYYPDTYLIPVDEDVKQVAQRFINRFNEVFAPYAQPYIDANIRWVTGLKIASLIAREAAGAEDMKLISGIIWNRLDQGMPLQIDATMQYTLGKGGDGLWWGNIRISEKQKDSPYNSYLHKGLPPTPICSPNIEYIKAALYPEETTCIFYLHDRNKQIHCAETYEEHLRNIGKYLD